jgi:hypothetical protein
MRRVSVRTDLAALLALTAALGIFFWKLLFTNLILARGDTFFYIYPYWSAAAEALRSGRLPLWNPHLFMGAPFLANSQAGTLYPFNWPLWLLLSTPIAAKVSIALHLLIAGVASYGFARQGLRLRPAAAWFAAFSFMLGGYLTAQVEHVNQVQGLAWLPAVFWLLARPRMRGRPWLLGAILGLQILAGHTQAVFITIVGGGIYAAWLSWPALRARLHGVAEDSLVTMPLSDLAIAGVVGFVLAAAQVFPTVELSGESIRGSGLPVREALSFSLHPLLVGRALLPGYGETLFTEYVAFVPLTGILMASIGLWGRWRHAMGLALVGAVGLFFALGATNPVYVLLVRLIPGFGLVSSLHPQSPQCRNRQQTLRWDGASMSSSHSCWSGPGVGRACAAGRFCSPARQSRRCLLHRGRCPIIILQHLRRSVRSGRLRLSCWRRPSSMMRKRPVAF